MNSKNKNGSVLGGVSIVGVTQIVFIILKLCKLIDWKWWIVLSPTWISIAFSTIFIIVVGFVVSLLSK